MKRIDLKPLREGEQFENEVAVSLVAWLTNSPDGEGRGLSIATIRKRFTVIDLIEEAQKAKAEYVDLEDVQYETLKEVVRNCRFVEGNRIILQIEDRINEAKAPPKPE